MQRQIFVPFLMFSLYFLISFTYAVVYKADHLLDFLLSFKVIVYFIIICFSVGKKMGGEKAFVYFFRMVLAFFFLKYSLSVLLKLNMRPLVFRENNFELLFFVLLFYLKYILIGKVRNVEWFLVTVILVLSLSRSALPLYFIVASAIVFERVSLKKVLIAVPFVTVLAGIFIMILLNRPGGGGLENIDRIVFMQVYINEALNMPFWNFLFGAERISPLSPQACERLSFYKELFSYNNDGTCYSVILHSFVLRALYDHGLILFLGILYITYYMLRVAKYSKKESFVVTLVVLLNGLSVSSFNSYFFPLSMILFLGFAHLRKEEKICR
ncbi:TPA: hypothetical protein QD007_001198 [Shewanella algae]|uniref:hypothetical protein n=1 Tax=Shewanella algae TaxID=38313 RepID=UPI001C593250|nr:hypothetical protein [Shewanella algae]HDS1210608.1 hypothetical protein [Shewanella algae]